ncbi:MAG: hypothetical protein ABIL58_27135 [Pseudomonadota bacterium]
MDSMKDFFEKYKSEVDEGPEPDEHTVPEAEPTINIMAEALMHCIQNQICVNCGNPRMMMYRGTWNEHETVESFHCPECGENYSAEFNHEEKAFRLIAEDNSWIDRLMEETDD